jgi:hypothetical protein
MRTTRNQVNIPTLYFLNTFLESHGYTNLLRSR